MNLVLAKKYFNRWCEFVTFKRYDKWCDILEEELEEQDYARENNLEPIYWCWKCRHDECDIHFLYNQKY